MSVKLPKKLTDIAKKYNYKIILEHQIGHEWEYQGECDYATSTIRLALYVADDWGRPRKQSDDTLTYILAHELSHMIDYEENGAEATDKLADQTNLLYGGNLYSNKEVTTRTKLAALRGVYKAELAIEQATVELLKSLKLFTPGMLQYVVDAHMSFHRYYQMITIGQFCSADSRRVEGVSFTPLWEAKINDKNIKLMTDFMNKHPQFRSKSHGEV